VLPAVVAGRVDAARDSLADPIILDNEEVLVAFDDL
jgi:hypothetical protein